MLTSVRGILAATLLTGCAFAATPALADETDPPSDFTISGNVAVVSDYRFRGLSQSNGDPAVQGAININHSSGFYIGTWASSIDFSTTVPAVDPVYGNLEVDIYAGWTGGLGAGVTADVGLLYYAYPGGKVGKAEFFEPYASLSTTMGPVTGKVGVAYAFKQEALNFNGGGNDDNFYGYLDLGVGIPETPISLAAHVGYTKGALSPKFATGASADYAGGWDYNIGATFNITKNLSIGAQYVGVDGASIDGYSNDTVIGTLKLAF
jgi:uncharacterized protein (TIGR02001 family)